MTRRPTTYGPFEQPSLPPTDHDALIDLQIRVLDALEAAGHPNFAAANDDDALGDDASASERKAWLAIYGPLTDVQV